MAVVINEFEVVSEPQPAPSSTPSAQSPVAQAAPSPDDVVQLIRRQLERSARVWAH